MRDLADSAVVAGITPLEVMLATMRALHKDSHDEVTGKITDAEKAIEAASIAKDAAPFVHAKLSNVQAAVSVSDDIRAWMLTASVGG